MLRSRFNNSNRTLPPILCNIQKTFKIPSLWRFEVYLRNFNNSFILSFFWLYLFYFLDIILKLYFLLSNLLIRLLTLWNFFKNINILFLLINFFYLIYRIFCFNCVLRFNFLILFLILRNFYRIFCFNCVLWFNFLILLLFLWNFYRIFSNYVLLFFLLILLWILWNLFKNFNILLLLINLFYFLYRIVLLFNLLILLLILRNLFKYFDILLLFINLFYLI